MYPASSQAQRFNSPYLDQGYRRYQLENLMLDQGKLNWLMIYYILIASLFGNVQILLGEFRCWLLSGLAKQTAVSFVKLHWISLLFHTAWDELIKWTFCIMRSAPTVLIKVNMSFAGSEKTHGVSLLFIAQEVFNSLITYDISSFPFSIVIGLLRVEFNLLNSREPSQFTHSHENKK